MDVVQVRLVPQHINEFIEEIPIKVSKEMTAEELKNHVWTLLEVSSDTFDLTCNQKNLNMKELLSAVPIEDGAAIIAQPSRQDASTVFAGDSVVKAADPNKNDRANQSSDVSGRGLISQSSAGSRRDGDVDMVAIWKLRLKPSYPAQKKPIKAKAAAHWLEPQMQKYRPRRNPITG